MTKGFFRKLKKTKSKFDVKSIKGQHNPYIYDCLNENGDVISHCGYKGAGPDLYEVDTLHQFSSNVFIKSFKYFQGTTKVFLLYPPTQERIFKKYKVQLHALEDNLTRSNILVIDSLVDNVYPEACFYDGEYHLNCNERIKRTNKVIKFLKDKL